MRGTKYSRLQSEEEIKAVEGLCNELENYCQQLDDSANRISVNRFSDLSNHNVLVDDSSCRNIDRRVSCDTVYDTADDIDDTSSVKELIENDSKRTLTNLDDEKKGWHGYISKFKNTSNVKKSFKTMSVHQEVKDVGEMEKPLIDAGHVEKPVNLLAPLKNSNLHQLVKKFTPSNQKTPFNSIDDTVNDLKEIIRSPYDKRNLINTGVIGASDLSTEDLTPLHHSSCIELIEKAPGDVAKHKKEPRMSPLLKLKHSFKRHQEIARAISRGSQDKDLQWRDTQYIRGGMDEEDNWTTTPLFHPFWYECMTLVQKRKKNYRSDGRETESVGREKKSASMFELSSEFTLADCFPTRSSLIIPSSSPVKPPSYYSKVQSMISIHKYFW